LSGTHATEQPGLAPGFFVAALARLHEPSTRGAREVSRTLPMRARRRTRGRPGGTSQCKPRGSRYVHAEVVPGSAPRSAPRTPMTTGARHPRLASFELLARMLLRVNVPPSAVRRRVAYYDPIVAP
jgi:hypothetical protein